MLALAPGFVIVSEYASKRWRGLAVSLQSTGYALGATLGGLLAVWLLGQWGWRSVFLFGGIVTVCVLPLVWLWLPESLDFLLARRPANALVRVNRLAARLGHPALAQLPALAARVPGSASGFRQLLAPAMRRTTLVIWLLFFLVMFGFYFVMSWTPKLLMAAGLSAQQGITGGVLLSVGGILGAALIGGLASRWPLTRVLVLFVANGASASAALALGLLIGLFANGCVAGLYALSPVVYDASVRATGVGWGICIGRMGAIVSPTVAGVLLDGGWQPLNLYGVFASVFVLAAGCLLLLRAPRPAPVAVSDALSH
ncbi:MULTISPECIES: MFS transporter [Pseudomonas]|uniref:MFS transporter n=1 Tax=Pseudomonas sp. PARCl1 TaxID=2853444 RepID=UPI00244D0416|nr:MULTISPECIES: MFS transporter [Pseudomonas]MDH1548843.1 MFS transporter [Pseudomonas juntendi]